MIDNIPGTMTQKEAEKAAGEWQKQQDEFPGPVSVPPQPEKPPVQHSDFHERTEERARRREDYMRQGTPD